MYQEFFALNQPPFLIKPDPDFLFFSEQHKEALAHLTYGLQGNGGFVVLTGELGIGKTTICQFLLQDMPADTDITSITNPAVSEIDLLVNICNQFSIKYDNENISLKVMFDALASWMLENHQRGRHAIVLIDEAQHLTFKVLEQLRLLTNIEADNQKPLQIILVGQTKLQKKLLTPELRQLSQRITARYHLRTLNKQETSFYIQHRLNVAGASGPIFETKSIPLIHKASQGIPSIINQICDRCLVSSYSHSYRTVSPRIARMAIKESDLPKKDNPFKPYILHVAITFALILATLFITRQQPVIENKVETDLEIDNLETDMEADMEAEVEIEPDPETESVENAADDSKEKQRQKEWLRVINTANDQQETKKLPVTNVDSDSDKQEKEPATAITEKEPETIEKEKPEEVTLTSLSVLFSMPSENYSLQLASLSNEKSVNKFFKKYPGLQERTYLYQGTSSGKLKFVILLGSFNSYKMAKIENKKFKKQYPAIDPWIKDYQTIHNDIK